MRDRCKEVNRGCVGCAVVTIVPKSVVVSVVVVVTVVVCEGNVCGELKWHFRSHIKGGAQTRMVPKGELAVIVFVKIDFFSFLFWWGHKGVEVSVEEACVRVWIVYARVRLDVFVQNACMYVRLWVCVCKSRYCRFLGRNKKIQLLVATKCSKPDLDHSFCFPNIGKTSRCPSWSPSAQPRHTAKKKRKDTDKTRRWCLLLLLPLLWQLWPAKFVFSDQTKLEKDAEISDAH